MPFFVYILEIILNLYLFFFFNPNTFISVYFILDTNQTQRRLWTTDGIGNYVYHRKNTRLSESASFSYAASNV
jgi:hypothetical protein